MGDIKILRTRLRDCPKGVAQPQWHCLTTKTDETVLIITKDGLARLGTWLDLGFDIKIFNYAAT